MCLQPEWLDPLFSDSSMAEYGRDSPKRKDDYLASANGYRRSAKYGEKPIIVDNHRLPVCSKEEIVWLRMRGKEAARFVR